MAAIEYFEIQIPNVDPAPGIERAEVKPKEGSLSATETLES